MKTQWNLQPFSLELGHLWDIRSGIRVEQDYQTKLAQAWDQFLHKSKTNQIGFFDWPLPEHSDQVEELKELAQKLRKGFQGAICMGIGGSYLGPMALQEILNPLPLEQDFQVQWISNADSAPIARAKKNIQSKKCLAVVISKSGGTTETLAAWFHLSPHFSKDSVVVITDPNHGELRRLSQREGWYALPVPPTVGGRFSVLTAVGLFPLALQGIAVSELIEGAKHMRDVLMGSPTLENPALWYAYSKFLWDKQGNSIQYLMPYDTRMKLLSDWYVQLWAESLGKKELDSGNSVGPNPVSALGTSDQHSLLQLFKEGPRKRIIGFLTAEDPESPQVGTPAFSSPDFEYLTHRTFSELNLLASQATEESLHLGEVPTYRFSLPRLSPFNLGAFIFFQETACALAGELYKVNAFDQPGVEETKKILKSKLTAKP
ncbi:MAG: glucose-6-phosphate isomerase [Proteobacteria bacterium]|nr:glucose-6-phosphate isomerase [Pseudomonadota bacterium]